MNRSVTFLLFMTVSLGSVWADDAIKVELDKARATYSKQIEGAKHKFLAAAESKLQEYARKGDFENAQAIENEKANFERDGSLPSSAKLSSAMREYKSEVRAA